MFIVFYLNKTALTKIVCKEGSSESQDLVKYIGQVKTT